jgi:hypothetical protein
MAKKIDAPVYTADTLAVGLATIPVEALIQAIPEDTNPRGIVLSNERTKVTLMVEDTPIVYTVGVYISRDPLNDGESAKIDKMAAERKVAKADREKTEHDRLAREKQAAFTLGQQSTVEMLRNIETLKTAADSLNRLR